MSLFFYGVFILGIVLGGVVVLVLFSLLAMARKGDECLDQLELEMHRGSNTPLLALKAKNQKTSVCRPPPTCITAALALGESGRIPSSDRCLSRCNPAGA